MINKFIQELNSISSVDLDLSAEIPIAVETAFDTFQTFKATLEQFKQLLQLIPVELLELIEQNPQFTNLIYEIREDKLVINYDETTLIELQTNLVPLVEAIKQALTNTNTNELYNLHDELTKIQVFLENFSGYGMDILVFPYMKNPALGWNNLNNLEDFPGEYNYTLQEFKNKIIIHFIIKSPLDLANNTDINLYNFQTIFDTLGAKKTSAIIEVEVAVRSYTQEPITMTLFLVRKKIAIYAAGKNSKILFYIANGSIPNNMFLLTSAFSFKVYFNYAGFYTLSHNDTTHILSVQELESVVEHIQIQSATNTDFATQFDQGVLYAQFNNEISWFSILLFPPIVDFSITKIDIFLGFTAKILPKYQVEIQIPFYKIASNLLTVNLSFSSAKLGDLMTTTTILNNKKDTRVLITWEYPDLPSSTIKTNILSSYEKETSIIDFEIDYTKFNDIGNLTFQVTEQSKQIILNVKLKDPFILANGLLPDYFKPSIIPEQSEDLIAVFIDTLVGSLDILQFLTINLIIGETKGFFKYFAYAFSPTAFPQNFNPNQSDVLFPVVSLGGHTEISEVSNIMSSTSTYQLEMKNENAKKYLKLISSVDGDEIFFEKQRKRQFQLMMQSFSTKLLDTTLYFQTTISSNRSGLNLNLFNPNQEYNGSDVSVYVPIRETEYVFNGYLRLDLLNDKYQNTQAITNNYFIKAELHMVDYYCIDGIINKRISNEATYNFDEKLSRTIVIFVNNLTDTPKSFFFNLDLVFGLRQNENCDFWIRVVHRDLPVKLVDQNPSIQVLPDLSYGVQYSSADTNFAYEKKFTIVRTVTTAPLDVKTQKFNFAMKLSTDLAKCGEIPYETSLFATVQDLALYPTLAQVQALIVDVIAGGTIDLTEYPTFNDLSNLETEINNYIVTNFATKNEMQTTNANVTNVQTAVTNLQNDKINYYTKTESDGKFALISDLETINTGLSAIDESIQNINEQFLRKAEAISTYSTIVTTERNKDIAQPSIVKTIRVSEQPTYKAIPQSAKLIEITVSPKQVRDNYLGFLDKDYAVDDDVILHVKVNVTLDDTQFTTTQVFSTFGEFAPLGRIENGEHLVDFLCHNSWNSTFRADLRGSILGKINPATQRKWIGSGVKLVNNSSYGEHYQYQNAGPSLGYFNSSIDTLFIQVPNKSRYVGAFLLEHNIGADNIQYAKHSALATGQIPINIVFALKTHRPIYFEIKNPFAPQINVTFTLVADKENEFAWIQQPIDYQNSIFLIFTGLISQSIPSSLKYITDEFKTAGLRYKNYDSNCEFTGNYNNGNFDTYQCPTINSVLAYTMSVFPDFYRMPTAYTIFFEKTRFKNGYLNHPANLYYYIIVNHKNLIYRTEKKDYLSFSTKYDGRTIDLSSPLKFVGTQDVGGGSQRDPGNSLLAHSACLSHSVIQGSFEVIRQEFRRVAWKYIVRKNFSQFGQRIMSWAENVVYFDSQSGSDTEQKAIASIKPSGCILYVEPDLTTTLYDKLIQWFNITNSNNHVSQKKILDLATTYNEQAKTKWIEINLILTPLDRLGTSTSSNIWSMHPGTQRTSILQGEFIDTSFAVLDNLPADINYINF